MIQRLKQAKQQAMSGAAQTMTERLRSSALSHGWPNDVVSHMDVRQADKGFQVHVHPDYAKRAHVLEYGSESSRPTAAIRKFSNDTKAVHGAVIANIEHVYGGK